jgi:putative transcriptional regulator
MSESVPVSVVEMPEFLTAAGRIMADEERTALVDHIWPGTGPAAIWCPVRAAGAGCAGRSRAAASVAAPRVIYFFHSPDVPLFALTAYAKSARADLSQADRNRFRRQTGLLVESYGRRPRRGESIGEVADSIRRGLEEALAFARAAADASHYRVHVPERIDVRAIRTRLGMTQEELVACFGFGVNMLRSALRDYHRRSRLGPRTDHRGRSGPASLGASRREQGKRQPEGPTRAYLLVIDRAPDAVQKALRAA